MIKKVYDIMGKSYSIPCPDPIKHFRYLNLFEFEMLNDYEKESYLLSADMENRRWAKFEENIKNGK